MQVENNGQVSRIAAAVDASRHRAQGRRGQGHLLVVHHGLFWSPQQPWTGKKRDLIGELVQHNLAVYSAHLPLDLHPRHGNNAGLLSALKFTKPKPFFEERGQFIGLRTSTRLCRDILGSRLKTVLGAPPVKIEGGPSVCRKIGIVTGGAGGSLAKAAAEGGHFHYRRRRALDRRAGRGAGDQRFLRRPLRDRDVWREGAFGSSGEEVSSTVDVSGSSDGPVESSI